MIYDFDVFSNSLHVIAVYNKSIRPFAILSAPSLAERKAALKGSSVPTGTLST